MVLIPNQMALKICEDSIQKTIQNIQKEQQFSAPKAAKSLRNCHVAPRPCWSSPASERATLCGGAQRVPWMEMVQQLKIWISLWLMVGMTIVYYSIHGVYNGLSTPLYTISEFSTLVSGITWIFGTIPWWKIPWRFGGLAFGKSSRLKV